MLNGSDPRAADERYWIEDSIVALSGAAGAAPIPALAITARAEFANGPPLRSTLMMYASEADATISARTDMNRVTLPSVSHRRGLPDAGAAAAVTVTSPGAESTDSLLPAVFLVSDTGLSSANAGLFAACAAVFSFASLCLRAVCSRRFLAAGFLTDFPDFSVIVPILDMSQ
ncbi:MAG: hypothetical protein AAGA00_08745 [Pseudomonadota bacterium]